VHKGDDKPAEESHQDQKTVHFTCAINVSPGTCEVGFFHLKTSFLFDEVKALENRSIYTVIVPAAGGLWSAVPED
jgi:hypothetical protein